MKKILWFLSLVLCGVWGCAELKKGPGEQHQVIFGLKEPGLVTVKIFDKSGKEVETLFKDRAQAAGPLTVSWNGRGSDGGAEPTGTYFFWLTANRWDLKLQGQFGGLGSTPGKFLNPQGLCVSAQGARLTVAVADTGNQRAQVLTDTGGFLMATGSLGTGDGGLNQPTDVSWDGQILTVCDSRNHRLARFDERGTYLGQMVQLTGLQTSLSSKVVLDFQMPTCLQKGPGDDFWVADTGHGILFHVTSTGGVLEEWGNPFPLSLDGPLALVNGGFWVRSDRNTVQVVDSNGNTGDRLKLQPPSQAIGGIAATAEMGLVSDPAQDLIYFLDLDGKVFETLAPPQASQPTALALWEDQLFLIDAANHEILRYKLVSQPADQQTQGVNLP